MKVIRFNPMGAVLARVVKILCCATLLSIIIFLLPFNAEYTASKSLQLSSGTSQPGTFEIHIFDVEQGDSQLIIFPSGYTILIDVAEQSWNSNEGATLVAAKIRAITGGSHVNVGVITHLQLDNIGYVGYGGFWSLIEEEGITFDKIIDRDAGVWVDGSGGGTADGQCDEDLEIDWHNAGTLSNTASLWVCYATNPANTNIYTWRQLAQLGSTTQIDPPDTNAIVEIIQADAYGVMMDDGVTPVAGDHTTDPMPPSENNYSIALKVSFGTIDYVTAGGISGEYSTSEWGYTYNDIETVIADRIGHVELMHVNYNGSRHSSNQYYIDTLNPDRAFISCGSNSYGLPDQVVLDRLKATAKVYLTNLCDETRDYSDTTITDDDIVIRSSNGTTYFLSGEINIGEINIEVTENTKFSQDNKPGEINIDFPVYMRPSTSDFVYASILIPTEFSTIPIEFVSRKVISPQSAPVIGRQERDQANIVVDAKMRVELSSPTLMVNIEVPAIQQVYLSPNIPTYWMWSIVAPESEGYHILILKVFLDELSDTPSWVRSYQIEILNPTSTTHPTNTPVTSSTITPSPLPTNTPTITPSPTPSQSPFPTLTVTQKIGERIINSDTILLAIVGTLGTCLLWLVGLLIVHLKRQYEIQRIESELSGDLPRKEKERLEKELKRLKGIKWWQFWKWK